MIFLATALSIFLIAARKSSELALPDSAFVITDLTREPISERTPLFLVRLFSFCRFRFI